MRCIDYDAPNLAPTKLLIILSLVLHISAPILRQGANVNLSFMWREETDGRRRSGNPQETDEPEDGGKQTLLFLPQPYHIST